MCFRMANCYGVAVYVPMLLGWRQLACRVRWCLNDAKLDDSATVLQVASHHFIASHQRPLYPSNFQIIRSVAPVLGLVKCVHASPNTAPNTILHGLCS